jgi:hypothetical protein
MEVTKPMFEIAGLFLFLALAGTAFVAFILLAGLFKLVFKVALLPVALVGGALKLVLLVVGAVVGLVLMVVVGPVLLMVAAMVLVPLALFGGLAWAAISVVV